MRHKTRFAGRKRGLHNASLEIIKHRRIASTLTKRKAAVIKTQAKKKEKTDLTLKSNIQVSISQFPKSIEQPEELKLCVVCKEQFSSADDLKCHLAKHAGQMIYRCNVCSQTFMTASKWKKHIQDSVGTSHCEMCGQNFGCITAKTGHECSHFMFVCFECGAKFRKKWPLDRHLKFYHSIISSNTKCSTCNEELANKELLDEHSKTCSQNRGSKGGFTDMQQIHPVHPEAATNVNFLEPEVVAKAANTENQLPRKAEVGAPSACHLNASPMDQTEGLADETVRKNSSSIIRAVEHVGHSDGSTKTGDEFSVNTASDHTECRREAFPDVKTKESVNACHCEPTLPDDSNKWLLKKSSPSKVTRVSIVEDDVTQKILNSRVVFECRKCFKVYRSEKQLDLHKKVHMNKQSTRSSTYKQLLCTEVQIPERKLPSNSKTKTHACEICNANYMTQKDRLVHQAKHFGSIWGRCKHPDSNPIYICFHCTKRYSLKQLSVHCKKNNLKPSVLDIGSECTRKNSVSGSDDKTQIHIVQNLEHNVSDSSDAEKSSNNLPKAKCTVSSVANQTSESSCQNPSTKVPSELKLEGVSPQEELFKMSESTINEDECAKFKCFLLASNPQLQQFIEQSDFRSLLTKGLEYHCPLCKKIFTQLKSILNHVGLCWYFYFERSEEEIATGEEIKSCKEMLKEHMPPLLPESIQHVGDFIVKNLCNTKAAVKNYASTKVSWLNKENCFNNGELSKVAANVNDCIELLDCLQKPTNVDVPVEPPVQLNLHNDLSGFCMPFLCGADNKQLFEELKKYLFVDSVSINKPHECWFCGCKFTTRRGIVNHYLFKHVNTGFVDSKSQVQQANRNLEDDAAVESLKEKSEQNIQSVLPQMSNEKLQAQTLSCKTAEKNGEVEHEKLSDLRGKFSKLLCHLVGDPEVLSDLGWPQRLIDDVLVDVIRSCDQCPSVSAERSALENLRSNVSVLLHVCVKEQAMEKFGWNMKPVDDVVGEMLSGGDIAGM